MTLEDFMDNLSLWDAVKRPPESALKQIRGGRLVGMTDINPQWRYQAITEQLGPCGVGWKYTIDRYWLEPGTDGQMAAFAQVSVSVRLPIVVSGDGRAEVMWSEPVPGIGGSMLIAQEKSGLRTNDEAYKMATTDALSVALKMLGVGADIYMGRWDGSKYRDDQPDPDGQDAPGIITPEQAILLGVMLSETQTDHEKFLNFYGASSVASFPASKFIHAHKILTDKVKK